MAHKKVISLPVCLRPGHLHVTTCPAYPVGIRRGMLTTTLTRTDGPACGQIALPNPNSPPLFLWFHRLRLRIAIATILTWKKIVPSTCCTILLLLPVDGITVPVEATAGLPDRALYYRYYVTPSSSPCSGYLAPRWNIRNSVIGRRMITLAGCNVRNEPEGRRANKKRCICSFLSRSSTEHIPFPLWNFGRNLTCFNFFLNFRDLYVLKIRFFYSLLSRRLTFTEIYCIP